MIANMCHANKATLNLDIPICPLSPCFVIGWNNVLRLSSFPSLKSQGCVRACTRMFQYTQHVVFEYIFAEFDQKHIGLATGTSPEFVHSDPI